MNLAEKMRLNALTLWQSGKLKEALAIVRSALEDNPDDGKLWELCGLIYRSLEECPPCLSALETASSLVPLSFAGQCALADCYAFIEKEDLARDIYNHVLACIDQVSTDLLKALAVGFEVLNDFETALKVTYEAVRREPDLPHHRYAAAFYMSQLNYPIDETTAWARAAIRLSPESPKYRIGLAGFLYRVDRFDDAYDLVCDLSDSEIQDVTCGICLRRLSAIYGSVADEHRARICDWTVAMLGEQNEDGQCESC